MFDYIIVIKKIKKLIVLLKVIIKLSYLLKMERIEFYLTNRAGEALDIAAVVFSNEEGVLGKTSKADSLFEQTSRFVRQKKGR